MRRADVPNPMHATRGAFRDARAFAYAASAVAEEAANVLRRSSPDLPDRPSVARALAMAEGAAGELERLAREGGELDEAYRLTTQSLQALAVALTEMRGASGAAITPEPRSGWTTDTAQH